MGTAAVGNDASRRRAEMARRAVDGRERRARRASGRADGLVRFSARVAALRRHQAGR